MFVIFNNFTWHSISFWTPVLCLNVFPVVYLLSTHSLLPITSCSISWVLTCYHTSDHSIVLIRIKMVKNPPAMWDTWIWSLGWEDPLEKGMAIHSSILGWRIPRREELGRLQSIVLQRVGQDRSTNTRTPTRIKKKTVTFEFTVSSSGFKSFCFRIASAFCCCCSVAKSCLTLWSHGLQHARLTCPSLFWLQLPQQLHLKLHSLY